MPAVLAATIVAAAVAVVATRPGRRQRAATRGFPSSFRNRPDTWYRKEPT
jgi:hypothetical protein